jgi:hypothetical protein
MMKLLSLVLATVWLVGQVSAFTSSYASDDPSLLSSLMKTTDDDDDDENNNNIITGGLVDSKRVTIIQSGTTANTKKIQLAGSSEAWQRQLHSKFALKEQRQLQSLDDQACDVMEDKFLGVNAGAICICSPSASTFTCVHLPKCVDEALTSCGGSGEICFVLTNTYYWSIQGTALVLDRQRVVTEYTSGGAHLRGSEIEAIGKYQCNFYMTTLDGRRYQCNDCSTDCPGDDGFNLDCSNIQADSTTNGQCVSITSTTVDLGLLNKYCVDTPIAPTTLAAANARSWSTGNYFLWYKNNVVLLATTALLTFSMWMI